ncbi:hypothetical protein OG241_15335 [Streptomyces sp. NBC_01390]|uniref:hypothetical protein n=1 Tax=Streptomyces sp. NBC_01390 TaxID=2903850 RepID=UPI0032513815
MKLLEPRTGVFVFESVTVSGAAAELADIFTVEIEENYWQTPGFVSARLYQDFEGDTLVARVHWADESDYRAHAKAVASDGKGFQDRLGELEILDRATFVGTQVQGFAGPAEGEATGYTVVATRRVRDRQAAHDVHAVLLGTGEWKHDIPGFVAATPYISLDGTEFLNNPQWVDRDAFQVYMNHPSIPGGLTEANQHEIGPPRIVHCRIVSDIGAVEG